MLFDLDLIRTVYGTFANRVDAARKAAGTPLTLTEKILYAHLFDADGTKLPIGHAYVRGTDYVNFRPDRVAMQDATAQMALLQFMNAGRDRSAVPASVHCDHLIQADMGADKDLPTATVRTAKCTTSSAAYRTATASASGSPAPGSSTRSYWRTMRSRAA